MENLVFENCYYIFGINYIPLKKYGNLGISNHFRIIRSAFQSIGQIEQARKYYYLEKCYERKGLWEIRKYYHIKLRMPNWQRKYADISDVFFHYKSRKLKGFNAIRECLFIAFIPFARIFFDSYAYGYSRIKYFASLIDYLIWGYGERPLRIIGVSIFTIIIFSLIYYSFDIFPLNSSYIYSFYFSLSNFTTLGFGDIQADAMPFSLKFTSVTEALIAMFFMGLVVSAYSNRSRY